MSNTPMLNVFCAVSRKKVFRPFSSAESSVAGAVY